MGYTVFCDLDGTLLNKSSVVSEATKDFFKKFIKNGNNLVFATGRSYGGCIKIYDDLGLNTPLICDNGGFIINPKDKKFKPILTSMPSTLFKELFNDFKDKVASAIFNRGEQAYSYKHVKEFEWLVNMVLDENIIECEFDKLDVSPSGMMLLVHNSDFNELNGIIENKYKELFSRNWGSDRKYTFYEVGLKTSHKGAAVERIIKLLKLDPKKTICFGDGLNDIEMVKNAYHGVAVKNAYEEVRMVAAKVTEDNNDHDGVINYLRKYLDLDY